MKNTWIATGMAAFMSVGCATTSPDTPRARITNDAELSAVTGKRLVLDDNHLTINSDGTLEGEFGGVAMEGTWEFQDEFWCRTMMSGSERVMSTPVDCQMLEYSDSTLYVRRDRGNGTPFQYEIER